MAFNVFRYEKLSFCVSSGGHFWTATIPSDHRRPGVMADQSWTFPNLGVLITN